MKSIEQTVYIFAKIKKNAKNTKINPRDFCVICLQ